MKTFAAHDLPTFIPKVQDANITKWGLHFPMVIMDARHTVWRKNLPDQVRSTTDQLVIDPATDALLCKGSSTGVNIQKFGYPKNLDAAKLFGNPQLRKEVIEIAIDYQVTKKSSVIVAPYFYAEDPDTIHFSLNLTILGETIKYMKGKKIDRPLFAYIELGNTTLNKPATINFVVDRYNDYKDEVAGFFLTVNDFDTRKRNEDDLQAISWLVLKLSKLRPVFVNNINGFGDILCALGASGCSSGLTTGETFSIMNMQKSAEDKKFRKQDQKTYVPELLDYLNDEAVKKIGYQCRCQACKGSYPQNAESKKRHFVISRFNALNELAGVVSRDRVAFMEAKLKGSMDFSNMLNDKGVKHSSAFHQRWLNVLKTASGWDLSQNDNELEQLLADINGGK